MTPEEYRKAWQAHHDAYFTWQTHDDASLTTTGSNDHEAIFRADLIMGLTELVEAANRIADNGHRRRNEH